MATSAPRAAPKAGPKPVAAPEAASEAPAPKKSTKKLIILIVAAIVILAGAGGGAWFYMQRSSGGTTSSAKQEKQAPPKMPVFVVMEPFTVNLQPDGAGDQFLQTAFTLQVENPEQEELIKSFMPQVRSRLLFLLSSKKASEITSVEGKKKLTAEIIAAVNQPFTAKGEEQKVADVFFTSFVIQAQ